MIIYLLIFFLGVIMGYYLGSRKFQRAVSRFIGTMRHYRERDEDEDDD